MLTRPRRRSNDAGNGATLPRLATERRAHPDDAYPQTTMRVRKRNGRREPVDVNKIVRAVSRCCVGLPDVDAMRVATKTISGLYDGATTRELDQLSIQTAAALIVEEPQYAKLAGAPARDVHRQGSARSGDPRVLAVDRRGAASSASSTSGSRLRRENARKLNDAITVERDREFEYFGLRTVYDRYLLKHPKTRLVHRDAAAVLPAHRVRALRDRGRGARALPPCSRRSSTCPARRRCSTRARGTSSSRAASCSTRPTITSSGIYQKYTDVALLSKFSGGIGLAYHRVRSRGSLIESTNGHSNGIVPWLKTLDASVSAVNQGGKRKGACCVYLEPWHADIEEFLELRDNTGDEASRTHNLNLANWIPRSLHAARRGGRRIGACSTRRSCRTSRSVRRRVRARLRASRGGGPRREDR